MPTLKFDRRSLKGLRVARGWSMERAAVEIGISPVTLHNLEAGKVRAPQARTLAKIAQVYGVTMDSLFPGLSVAASC